MKERVVTQIVRGTPALDGAGVRLVRVLGPDTVYDFDPFLMLDSFDSRNPDDYTRGFPMHPHRGIETLTYLVHGEIDHEDSLGNSGKILDGSAQWMTAGSGILHQEMPQPAERILGIQLWINLLKKEKMTEPKYFDILPKDVKPYTAEDYKVNVLSGNFHGVTGVTPHHLQVTFFDVALKPNMSIEVPAIAGENAFIFLLEGDCTINKGEYTEKSALLLSDGDFVRVDATDKPLRFLFIQGPRVNESIAWGGPIVMNTREELQLAFSELRAGTFIK
ncbi:MAG TPA: pirin family protein [Bellilinea sp.]|nr:pirin family protein [Bellilinea sp.]